MLLSAALDYLDGYFKKIARSHFIAACVILVIFTSVSNGLITGPIEPYQRTAENPFETVQGYKENYFQESILLPLLAYYTRLTSKSSFPDLSLAIVVLGFVAFVLQAKQTFGQDLALLALALLLVHPITLVLFSWLGMPDCITFLLTVLLFFTQSYAAVATISFLGALNHPLIIFIGPTILILRRLSWEDSLTYRHVLVSIVSLSVGTLAVHEFLKLHGITATSRLDYITARSWMIWVNLNLSNLPLTIFSLHNTLWLALGACCVSSFSKHRAYWAALLMYQLLAYGVTFFCFDTTRVFALLTWAPLLHAILYSIRLNEGSVQEGAVQLRKALILIALFGLFKPNYYMWNGEVHESSFNIVYSSALSWLRASTPTLRVAQLDPCQMRIGHKLC